MKSFPYVLTEKENCQFCLRPPHPFLLLLNVVLTLSRGTLDLLIYEAVL